MFKKKIIVSSPESIEDLVRNYSANRSDINTLANELIFKYNRDILSKTPLAEEMCLALEDAEVTMREKCWIVLLFWNFSNTEDVPRVICRHLPMWKRILTEPEWKQQHASELKSEYPSPFRTAVSVMNNCAQRCPEPMLEHKIEDLLVPLMNDDSFTGRASAAVAVAYLLGNSDPETGAVVDSVRLQVNSLLIDLLVTAFQMAKPNLFKSDFDHRELGGALVKLAGAESNKAALSKHIPTLITCLSSATHEGAQAEVLEILWQLAFSEANRSILNEHQLVEKHLPAFLGSENAAIVKACAGLRFLLVEKDAHTNEANTTEVGPGHIMVSYNWDNQALVMKLVNRLKRDGFQVWVDVEEMAGSTLDSMARAVDNASAVLLGVSNKYKQSANCRLEAEYAVTCHKNIIPLMMQSEYKPTGWLGLVLGSKLWINFTQSSQFEEAYKNLKKQLVKVSAVTGSVDSKGGTDTPSVESWDEKEVGAWLQKIGLGYAQTKCIEEEVKGNTLGQLAKWRKHNLESCLKMLDTLGVKKVGHVGTFFAELEKII
eukprot:gb/GEZN01005226.1/.p1 GENE.gb/GEZN01005226.1/~~gb/GEZN01005226.1/.p1  ORF type:complete len:544 (+),score=88.93 gb/GEZN01005226.1/:118-1749(+)